MDLTSLAKYTPRGLDRVLGNTSLFLKQNSPAILTTVGIAGVVTAAVLASKASRNLDPILDNTKSSLEAARSNKHNLSAEEYSSADHSKSLIRIYTRAGLDLCKLYGPSVTLGGLSILMIVGGHSIQSKRLVTTAALLKGSETTFAEYRKQVAKVIGEEAEKEIRLGIREEVVENEETGNEEVQKYLDKRGVSQYARFFDETNSSWQKNPEYNKFFLMSQQDYFTDKLRAFGHVFLNEVYEKLGIPKTEAGQIVGWRLGMGDDFVDFGLFNVDNPQGRLFVNGLEDSILMDFNVAGPILHTLDRKI